MATALSARAAVAPVRILNVDADQAIRLSKSACLKSEGFDVLDASTGIEALALAEQFDPEVVLLDINLPDLDAYEVCDRLRTCHARPGIILQIVALRASPADWRKSLEAGADSYLIEPSKPWVLLRTINTVLSRRMLHA
jgi:DNA-binding response OmpR family regulator